MGSTKPPQIDMPSSADQGSGKLWNKITEAPLVPIGLTGGVAALVTSIVAYSRKSDKLKPSVYIIHTRMAVQGIIIGTLAGGVAYHLWRDHVKPYFSANKNH